MLYEIITHIVFALKKIYAKTIKQNTIRNVVNLAPKVHNVAYVIKMIPYQHEDRLMNEQLWIIMTDVLLITT